MMLFHADGKPLKTHLRTLSVLVFLLILTHHCRGQSQLIGSPQPIVAYLGGDIILPCYLVPVLNAADFTLEWTRPDMDPRFVHVMRLGHEMVDKKHELFKGRTSMFTDELKNGNISLKLSNVQLSDQGKYRCFIPELDRQAFVQLVCASSPASPPVISLSGLDGQSGGLVLQCESAGWYQQPEVLWLDAEGKLLSAGPPETFRGPDDLYTVSSRVTVEKRPSKSFTCRVQRRNTNHITQTHFSISDDFLKLQSSSSSHIIGLAVSLAVCILLMLAVSFFFLWKRRQNIFNTIRNLSECFKTNKTKDQISTDEEKGKLTTSETVPMETLKDKGEEESKQLENQPQDEKSRREEAEKKLKDIKEELEKQLQEEKSRREEAENKLKDIKEEANTGFNIEVDQRREYIRLINTSTEVKQLGEWKLTLQVNNKEKKKKYKFDESLTLKAEETVTIWLPMSDPCYPPNDLVWKDLRPWSSGDILWFSLRNKKGLIQHQFRMKSPERQ